MTAMTWAEFFKNHKDQDEYNKGAMEITQLHKPKEDKNQMFTKFTEAQALVVVSKSALDSAA